MPIYAQIPYEKLPDWNQNLPFKAQQSGLIAPICKEKWASDFPEHAEKINDLHFWNAYFWLAAEDQHLSEDLKEALIEELRMRGLKCFSWTLRQLPDADAKAPILIKMLGWDEQRKFSESMLEALAENFERMLDISFLCFSKTRSVFQYPGELDSLLKFYPEIDVPAQEKILVFATETKAKLVRDWLPWSLGVAYAQETLKADWIECFLNLGLPFSTEKSSLSNLKEALSFLYFQEELSPSEIRARFENQDLPAEIEQQLHFSLPLPKQKIEMQLWDDKTASDWQKKWVNPLPRLQPITQMDWSKKSLKLMNELKLHKPYPQSKPDTLEAFTAQPSLLGSMLPLRGQLDSEKRFVLSHPLLLETSALLDSERATLRPYLSSLGLLQLEDAMGLMLENNDHGVSFFHLSCPADEAEEKHTLEIAQNCVTAVLNGARLIILDDSSLWIHPEHKRLSEEQTLIQIQNTLRSYVGKIHQNLRRQCSLAVRTKSAASKIERHILKQAGADLFIPYTLFADCKKMADLKTRLKELNLA